MSSDEFHLFCILFCSSMIMPFVCATYLFLTEFGELLKPE